MSASGIMELPTVTFEEALKKEEEYKKKLKAAQHRPIVGPNLHQAPIKETTSLSPRSPFYTNADPVAQRLPLQSHSWTIANQRPLTPPSLPSTSAPPAFQPSPKPNQQQRNWPPKKARAPPQHRLPPYVQISRPAQPISYWCKLCKIDCTTEHNFRAHIGGKKHEAMKLSILQGTSNTRGESSGTHNRRNTNGNQISNSNDDRAAECEVRQEGEAPGLTSVREVEPSVENVGPSNSITGLIDLTTE